MTFQLWDTESANLVGSYTSQEAALAIVRKAIEAHGREPIQALVLLREDTRGHLKEIAGGSALVEFALTRSTPAA